MLNARRLARRPGFSRRDHRAFSTMLSATGGVTARLFLPRGRITSGGRPRFSNGGIDVVDSMGITFSTFHRSNFVTNHCDFSSNNVRLPRAIVATITNCFVTTGPSAATCPFLAATTVGIVSRFTDSRVGGTFVPHVLANRFANAVTLARPRTNSSLTSVGAATIGRSSNDCHMGNDGVCVSTNSRRLSSGVIRLILTGIPNNPNNIGNVSLFTIPGCHLGSSTSINRHGSMRLAKLVRGLNCQNTASATLDFNSTNRYCNCLVNRRRFNLHCVFGVVGRTHVTINFNTTVVNCHNCRCSLSCTGSEARNEVTPGGGPRSTTATVVRRNSIGHVLLTRGTCDRNNVSLYLCNSGLVSHVGAYRSTALGTRLSRLLSLLAPILGT